MANSYDVINISALAVPDAIVLPDAATLFSRWLARLRELDPEFDALLESDPAYKQGEVSAYQLTLAFQRVNDAVRAVFLASARGADLDQLGANFNVPRLVIHPGDPEAVPPVDRVMETDDAYRERIQLSWAQLNTAGARDAYRYHARSADSEVLDADAYGPETHNRPGEVDVYVLARTGNGEAGLILQEAVMNRLSVDDVRPLTDFVSVKSATIKDYTVTAELEIPEGPDVQTVLDNAIDTLRSYTQLAHRINALVPVSAIYAALQQPGVSRVRLINPAADIEAAAGQAPWCSAINVTRPGGSDGG
ncbi:baseplate assembly protein [Enterobacter sp. 22466]|uniref:baseplate assembly protein n=1 Tax=Enterobacter sp. 22466 TaxID=3453924 RepID=UPI003F85155E